MSPKEQREELQKSSFESHYKELKRRLVFILLSLMVTISTCFFFAAQLYDILVIPLSEILHDTHNRKLIFTGIAEGFTTYFKLGCYTGIIVDLPFIASQVYLFLAPALYKKEKKMLIIYIIASLIMFFLGLCLVYFVVIPATWKFFLSFESVGFISHLPIVLEAKIGEYLDMVLSLVIGFCVAFQLPIILIILMQIGVLEVSILIRTRRYAVVIIFVIAAVLTPPDVMSQIILAFPLLLLYEIAIICGKLLKKQKYVGHKINTR